MKIGPNLLSGWFLDRLNRFAALVELGFILASAAFSKALRQGVQQRVEVYAYRCRVSTEEIELDRELPILL